MIAAAPPQVSICIPTYNYGKFIADAIESVLAQTFGDFELLVVDNCSDDDTPQRVAHYVKKDNRIRYFRNDTNIGMVGNWNRCLELARGQYVKILCADDLLEPHCLEKSLEMIESNPMVALVSSARYLVSEKLEPISSRAYSEYYEHLRGFDVIGYCYVNLNLIGEPTAVLFKKKLAARGFNHDYQHLVDLEMWFHLLEQGDFVYTPEALCRIRMHAEQETNINIRRSSTIMDEFTLTLDYENKDYLSISCLDKCDIKYNAAYNLWQRYRLAENRAQIKSMITKQCNWHMFMLFNIQKKLRNIIRKNRKGSEIH